MQFNRLKRREFIMLLGGAAAWPRTLKAQGTDRARRIGVLMELAAGDPQARSNVAALQRGLRKLGWSQGGNLGIDYRWAPDDAVLVWRFAKELVELRPDVIVAHSSPVVATLLGQTRDIPIVFVSISDPIGEGFVASFARPGGNVTGFTNFEFLDDRKVGGGAQGDCPGDHERWLPIQPPDNRRGRIVFPSSNRFRCFRLQSKSRDGAGS